jgi:hypothetical protein
MGFNETPTLGDPMTNQTPEIAPDSTVSDITKKVKRTFAKHKTTVVLGVALAASVTINVVRKPMPKIADANWYALTHEDTKYLNGLLEADQADFDKF